VRSTAGNSACQERRCAHESSGVAGSAQHLLYRLGGCLMTIGLEQVVPGPAKQFINISWNIFKKKKQIISDKEGIRAAEVAAYQCIAMTDK
jgi:hypothetical protein